MTSICMEKNGSLLSRRQYLRAKLANPLEPQKAAILNQISQIDEELVVKCHITRTPFEFPPLLLPSFYEQFDILLTLSPSSPQPEIPPFSKVEIVRGRSLMGNLDVYFDQSPIGELRSKDLRFRKLYHAFLHGDPYHVYYKHRTTDHTAVLEVQLFDHEAFHGLITGLVDLHRLGHPSILWYLRQLGPQVLPYLECSTPEICALRDALVQSFPIEMLSSFELLL